MYVCTYVCIPPKSTLIKQNIHSRRECRLAPEVKASSTVGGSGWVVLQLEFKQGWNIHQVGWGFLRIENRFLGTRVSPSFCPQMIFLGAKGCDF